MNYRESVSEDTERTWGGHGEDIGHGEDTGRTRGGHGEDIERTALLEILLHHKLMKIKGRKGEKRAINGMGGRNQM
jgi:hypothetical protein